MPSTVITARLSEDELAALNKLASAMDRSRAWIVARAVRRHIDDESAFLDFLQKGIDDLDAGRSVPHDKLIERIRSRGTERHAA